MSHLETDRLILREWREEDFEPFARINNDPLIMEYFPRRLADKDSDKLAKRFQAHFKKYGYGPYVVQNKEDGAFMGFVGLQKVESDVPFKGAVEIAWRMDYEYWGKGYATEAALAVLHHAFTELGLKEVVAYAVHDNTRAIHVIEKIGMKQDPKGDFHYPGLPKDSALGNFVLYRMTKADYQAA